MKRYWELARSRIDGMSLRERAMIFAAVAFVAIALLSTLLLDPLLTTQKALTTQIVQQQEKRKELQAQMQDVFQAKKADESSPLRIRSAQLRQQLQEKNSYLQSLRDRLVEPDKMVDLLQQVLNKNGKLQLVSLKTLPVSPVMPQGANAAEAGGKAAEASAKADNGQKQIFQHGVQITVRGGYLDSLQYLAALEKLPVQLFWGDVSFSVDQYPDAVLTLTLYTLSLDKTWLAI